MYSSFGNYVATVLGNVFFNSYFLLFITAALGMALGKIKIKGFTLGSTGGIFVGIFVGWLVSFIAERIPETSGAYSSASSISSDSIVSSAFQMFFLLLFICAIGLSVGDKIRAVLNVRMLKLVGIGIFIPIVSMALTFACVAVAPSIVGNNYNLYQLSGLYSGSMTNTAALGTSYDVINNIDIEGRYENLSYEEKFQALILMYPSVDTTGIEISDDQTEEERNANIEAYLTNLNAYLAEDAAANETTYEEITTIETLTEAQQSIFLGKAKAGVATGYAISFPVGTILIIIIMTIIGNKTKKNKPADEVIAASMANKKKKVDVSKNATGHGPKGFFFNAICFGLVLCVGIFIGNIEIPLGNAATFSLSSVGGVLIAALFFGNFNKIGPITMEHDRNILGFIREFSLLFFMSIIGLNNGAAVIEAFTGTGLMIAIMAIIIEGVAILLAILLGRFALRMNWGLLTGAISGGCTSSVGLGAALNTLGGDEPTVGYGISQPFAILANVLLISMFHSVFFV